MGNKKLSIFAVLFSMLLGVAGIQAQVWNSRANDNQVKNLLNRLETRTDTFRGQLDNNLDRSRWDNTSAEDNVMAYVNAFENATDRLRRSFDDGQASRAELDQVLTYGTYIDTFMRRYQLSAAPEQSWNLIRNDLNRLSNIYRISWNWNQTLPPFTAGSNTGSGQVWNSRASDRQVENLLKRLETRTDTFRGQLDNRLDRGRWDNTSAEDNVMEYVNAFENATDRLRRSFDDGQASRAELDQVLTYGTYIDSFIRRYQLSSAPERSWNLIRNDLNQLSNIYRVSWNWNQTLPPFTAGGNTGGGMYQPNDAQVRNLLARLETRTNTFAMAAGRRFDNNTRWGNTQRDEQIEPYINAFENATDELRRSFNDRRITQAELNQVFTYGAYVDSFLRQNRMANNVMNQWNLIRNDLNQLSNLYRVSWNWNQTLPPFPSDQWARNNRLDGTYRLNVSMSDNVENIITRTVSNTSVRAQQSQMLSRRLTAPQAIAIDINGNQVTMATDFGAPVTLTADGRTMTETNARGRTTRTTVSMMGNTLNIVTDGDRNQDYRVSFTPISGNRLRVTRQIYLENQNQLISATSVYDRTSNTASWPPITRGRPGWNQQPVVGNFYIPNGTRLTAVLRNRIATNVSQAGDRFSMEVTSPNQYSGAIITGRIAQAEGSGRVSGRANLMMDFDSIQYRGQTYRFAGIIDSAREADGDTINISNEGNVRDGNQTTRTVTRAGIGAALGALIGAIAGGGDGAAIGAAVGAGAGAGTVLIQGRDNLQLEAGTEFSITATGPATVGYRN